MVKKNKDTPKVRVWPDTYKWLVRRSKMTGRKLPTVIDDLRQEADRRDKEAQLAVRGS